MNTIVERLNAALADRYRIEHELGAGGMATVYLAEDLKHDRRVALKVLKPELAAVLGGERFVQEIKTTAQLQHPHILPLFDSGTADGFLFYVMPYVEGETLREKLDRETQLGIDEAVRITREVADALDYAHRRGVIHRDIKPENILLHDGRPMVADFGIALAVSAAAGGRMTETGTSLGTPHYMSPEQATADREITARSDVYSLASVLYEMLTGSPPHVGSSAQQVIMKIITDVPRPVTELRRNVAPNVAAALATALEKLPADRFESARAFAEALADAHFSRGRTVSPAPGAAGPDRVSLIRRALPWVAAGALLGAVATLAVRRPSTETGRLPGPIFATLDVRGMGVRGFGSDNFAVSPDGRSVALAVDRSGSGVAVRSLDADDVQYLQRTGEATLPFWSPDARSIGFFADDSLKTVEVATGVVRALCPIEGTVGGTWGADGTILFASGTTLVRTRSEGGPCEVAVPEAHEEGQRFGLRPYFFPDGRHFLATGDMHAWLGEMGSDSLSLLRDLVRAYSVLAPPDYLLWNGGGRLLAQHIDLRKGVLVGEPVPILPNMPGPSANTAVSVSRNGVLVNGRQRWMDDPASDVMVAGRHLRVFERGRGILATLGEERPPVLWGPVRVSRDGRRVAMHGWNIQAMDLATGEWTFLGGNPERGAEPSYYPVWMPGDTAVVFVRGLGSRQLRIASVASGEERTVSPFPFPRLPACCFGPIDDGTPDGRRFAFAHGPSPSALSSAWEYELVADTVHHLFDAPGAVGSLRYAPTGKWLAYTVTAGGRTEVFVRPYPGPGEPVRVSTSGGRSPRWSGDGSQLFYLAETGVVAVPAGVGVSGQPQLVVPASALKGWSVRDFDVTPDGRRILFNLNPEVETLSLVLDWERLLTGGREP